MLDPVTIAALASTAVSIVTPLLQKMAEGGAAEAGKSAAAALLSKLKLRLSHKGSEEALDDLAKQPADADAQGALKMQLRKAIETNPELASFLKQWVADSKSTTGITQTTTVTGDHNTTTQIVGSGNVIR